ncbi:PREDICTED: titin homolog isoform X4 [Nicotiana attenuata]|uniref:titin homolog isoform X4 n=1 Tax=Nicotiana attenuata TaxID=49451 RepID=UPI0009054C0B|nr:PREDICTED: titin homolog isoform X4 [Nicotiana attenuata]
MESNSSSVERKEPSQQMEIQPPEAEVQEIPHLEGNSTPVVHTSVPTPPKKRKRAAPSENDSGVGRETSDIWKYFTKFIDKDEENFAKVTEEKKRKKKKLALQNRRSKDEIDECHLSYDKDNADGKTKKSKSSKQKKRKNDTLAESGVVDQSNDVVDRLGQENTISNEPGKPEKRKWKGKKRKSEKKAGKTEGNDFSKRQKGKSKEAHKIVEKDRPSSIAEDDLSEKTEQAEDEEIYELSSGDEDYSKGVRKWVTDYYQSRPGIKVLQERIDEFITDHEAKKEQERKEKEARAAEGGWTVVVHHKGRKKTTDSETGIAVGSVSQTAVMDNMAKKKKNDVGLDFYRFQKREAKRNEIMVLQSKFEQDKKRIQQLRAARKFRPY